MNDKKTVESLIQRNSLTELDAFVTGTHQAIQNIKRDVYEMRNTFDAWVDTLRSFCHAKDCSAPHDCPHFHHNCFSGLTLQTSAIWEVANVIQIRLLEEGVSFNENQIHQVELLRTEIETVLSLLRRHRDTLTIKREKMVHHKIDSTNNDYVENCGKLSVLADVCGILDRAKRDCSWMKSRIADVIKLNNDLRLYNDARAGWFAGRSAHPLDSVTNSALTSAIPEPSSFERLAKEVRDLFETEAMSDLLIAHDDIGEQGHDEDTCCICRIRNILGDR